MASYRSTRMFRRTECSNGLSGAGWHRYSAFVPRQTKVSIDRQQVTKDDINVFIEHRAQTLNEMLNDENYLISSETIEQWLSEIDIKDRKKTGKCEIAGQIKIYVPTGLRDVDADDEDEQEEEEAIRRCDYSEPTLYCRRQFHSLLDILSNALNKGQSHFGQALFREVCCMLKESVRADAFAIYSKQENRKVFLTWKSDDFVEDERLLEIAGSVTSCGNITAVTDSNNQDSSIMSVPIVGADGDVTGIVQLTRTNTWIREFTDIDHVMSNFIIGWTGIALSTADDCKEMLNHNHLNEYLVEAVTDLIRNIDHQETFMGKVISFTKALVQAERCSLIFVDQDKFDLYADLFDEGKFDEDGNPVYDTSKRMRFPLGLGIVGESIETGQVINVENASKDYRFSERIDMVAGCDSNQILCVPIILNNENVYGAVEAINKIGATRFTERDELSLTNFAVYIGMVVNYMQVYSKMRRDIIMADVAAEQLRYHMFHRCEEAYSRFLPTVNAALSLPRNFETVSYYPPPEMSKEEIQDVVHYMLLKTFDKNIFDLKSVITGIILIRENYPYYPYHNWRHAMCATHCCYLLFKFIEPTLFTKTEKLAFFFTALAHDMNYKRVTGIKRDEKIAYCLSTPFGDSHHYHTLVHILKCNDIFRALDPDEYREVLVELKDDFEALDQEAMYENLRFAQSLLKTSSFDLKIPRHKQIFKGLFIVTCDLCTAFKPWKYHMKDIVLVTREIGRLSERNSSLKLMSSPLSSYPRITKKKVPTLVLVFMKECVQPLIKVISTVCPNLAFLQDLVEANLQNWKRLENQEAEIERT